MAMTNALKYRNEKSFSEDLVYQMARTTFSSPIPSFVIYNGTIISYQFLQSWQNLQNLSSVNVIKKPNKPITTREQLMLITAFFGFSKSKLGELLGVSRQCIYDWFNNAEAAINNAKKIKVLADIAYEIAPKPSQQIFHIYANEVISGYDKSLVDYLLDDDIEKEKIVALSKTIYEMSIERWKRIKAIPKAQFGQNDID